MWSSFVAFIGSMVNLFLRFLRFRNFEIRSFVFLNCNRNTKWHVGIVGISKFRNLKCSYFENMKSRRRGPEYVIFGSSLQRLGYEFHIIQKTWNENLPISLFSSKGGNPYHPSTYRFPPLHQTGWSRGSLSEWSRSTVPKPKILLKNPADVHALRK